MNQNAEYSQEFAGRVAVVTGGSDGLGFDFCRALCQAGSEVYFCARNAQRGAAAENTLGAKGHYFQADLADAGQIEAFADFVQQRAGHVDYLINNIAIDDRIPFSDLTADVCDRMWQINLRSTLLMTHACLTLLRNGAGKSVVNIGTTNWMMGQAPFTLYNATKSGLLGFTRSLARELGSEGIRANMVSPGWVMTEKQLREHVSPQDQEELLRDQALKFLLEAKHLTPCVLFLLSSAAVAVTGQNLVVDGGKLMD